MENDKKDRVRTLLFNTLRNLPDLEFSLNSDPMSGTWELVFADAFSIFATPFYECEGLPVECVDELGNVLFNKEYEFREFDSDLPIRELADRYLSVIRNSICEIRKEVYAELDDRDSDPAGGCGLYSHR